MSMSVVKTASNVNSPAFTLLAKDIKSAGVEIDTTSPKPESAKLNNVSNV
jgi:hypothetical protein